MGVRQQRRMMVQGLAAAGVIVMMAGSTFAQVFRAAPIYPLSGSTSDATGLFALTDVGSLDGPLDGVPDIVVAEQNQFVTTLFGLGDGTFASGPNTPLGRIPSAMGVGDFDGDGVPDLLIGDLTNTVLFFRGTASGELLPFEEQGDPIPAGVTPVAVAAADVNGDHKLDAIVVDEGTSLGGVTVLLGKGDGTFTQSACSGGSSAGRVCSAPEECPGGTCVPVVGETVSAGAGSAAVAVADFNRDGKLDLAVANKVSNTVTVMRGTGTGFFTTVQTLGVGEEPIAIAAADANKDGRVDLIVTDRNGDNIAVLDGNADGSFATARYFTSGSLGSTPTGLALMDVNGDGAVDALLPNNRSSDVSVLFGDGHGNFSAPRAFVADQEPLGVAAADVNGDGVPDVVSVNHGGAQPDAAVLIGRGDGGFDAVEDVVTQPSPTGVAVGDVDNDGLADLIVAHTPASTSGGPVLVFRAQAGHGFTAPVSLESNGDAVAVEVGDLNGDGYLDIATANHPRCTGGTNAGLTCSDNSMCSGGTCPANGQVSVFIGKPTGGFRSVRNFPIGAGPTAMVVGDWNHDGRTDLAIAQQTHSTTGAVEVLLAAADGSFGAAAASPVGLSPVAIDYGDFNDDGHLDLAVASNTGPFTCAGDNSTCHADIDCGTKGPCNDSGDVTILMGDGAGGFQMLGHIVGARGPKAIAVADFDRDHHDDIAVARAMDSNVAMYFGDGNGNFVLGPSLLSVDNSPSAVAARDINGDGVPDLLVSDAVSNSLAMFRSQGANRRFRQDDDPAVSLRPIAAAAGDFDGDGRYDGATANSFAADSASVLTNIVGVTATTPAVLRGDANGDALVSAADAVAVMRELGDGIGTRIEEVKVGGAYAAGPGVDANGDGLVTLQDALAVAHRLFAGS